MYELLYLIVGWVSYWVEDFCGCCGGFDRCLFFIWRYEFSFEGNELVVSVNFFFWESVGSGDCECRGENVI